MKTARMLLLMGLAASAGAACKGSQPPPVPSAPKQPAPAAAKAAPTPAPASGLTPAKPLSPTQQPPQPAAFAYNPMGLRDPFEPFIKLEEKKSKEPAAKVAIPQTPLQRYSTDELKLAGIVWGDEGKARALIEDPQGKGYVVGVGTLVGDRAGKIAKILPDRIIIEEKFKDVLGEEKKNVANMMLHKSEGEVRR